MKYEYQTTRSTFKIYEVPGPPLSPKGDHWELVATAVMPPTDKATVESSTPSITCTMYWTWRRPLSATRAPCPKCGSIARKPYPLSFGRCIGCEHIFFAEAG